MFLLNQEAKRLNQVGFVYNYGIASCLSTGPPHHFCLAGDEIEA